MSWESFHLKNEDPMSHSCKSHSASPFETLFSTSTLLSRQILAEHSRLTCGMRAIKPLSIFFNICKISRQEVKDLLLLLFPDNSPRVVSKSDSLDLFSASFTKNIVRKEINATILLGHIGCSLKKRNRREKIKRAIAWILTL